MPTLTQCSVCMLPTDVDEQKTMATTGNDKITDTGTVTQMRKTLNNIQTTKKKEKRKTTTKVAREDRKEKTREHLK